MTTNDVLQSIQSFVADRFVGLPADLDAQTPLLESGAVDSLGMLDIVMHVEEAFGIMIDDDELIADHFETITAIGDLVLAKQS